METPGISKIVVVSGYFNPVHKGHIRMFKQARALGDELIVIVNNDSQVRKKGSVEFMNENERKEIIESIRYIDKVIISVDRDSTVCKTLARISPVPHIFANGGDRRTINDIPESHICKARNIKMIFNVGGDKIQSSSWLKQNTTSST